MKKSTRIEIGLWALILALLCVVYSISGCADTGPHALNPSTVLNFPDLGVTDLTWYWYSSLHATPEPEDMGRAVRRGIERANACVESFPPGHVHTRRSAVVWERGSLHVKRGLRPESVYSITNPESITGTSYAIQIIFGTAETGDPLKLVEAGVAHELTKTIAGYEHVAAADVVACPCYLNPGS